MFCYIPFKGETLSYEDYWEWRTPTHLASRHKVFASWIADGSAVLDVACGDGAFASYLHQEKQCSVVGVDRSDVAVKKARERGIEAHVMDVTKEMPDKHFDVVVLSAFIEHVVESEDVFNKYLRIANEVLVSIPNIAFIEHRLRLLFGRFPCQWAFHPSEHVRFWSVKDFRGQLAQMNVEIMEYCADDGIPLLKEIWINMFGDDVCFRVAGKVESANTGKEQLV